MGVSRLQRELGTAVEGVTANQTSSNSVYEGFQAYPLANGDTNENVIGNAAIGHGSNTTTLGNASVTDTYLAGTVHGTSFTGNAATATNFSGSLSGDVTGTQGATVVSKINGGSMPVSASVLASNSSSQPVAATGAQVVAVIGSTPVANATTATNVNGGTVSATTGTFSGTVAAGATTPTTIGSNGVLLNGVPALQSQTSLNNYYSGGAGNLTGTGLYNTANGYQAGVYIADGVTPNQTSSNSVYEGFQAHPLASGDTNETVIGNTAIGHGSNTTTLGNTATVGTWLNGTQHITATAPTASAGSVATYSSNAGGAITGLSAATTVTITFANSGWTNAAFCVATPSVSLATAPYVSAISPTTVTFTFVALTGNLYYHCDGN